MTNPAGQGRLRILTWHIHGNYLYYLVQAAHEFYLPVRPDRSEGYAGRTGFHPRPDNVHGGSIEEIPPRDFDCVLLQSRKKYAEDRFEILTDQPRQLLHIDLEPDLWREHPTNTGHIPDEPKILLIHVIPFNSLMWAGGHRPTGGIDAPVLAALSYLDYVAFGGDTSSEMLRVLRSDIFTKDGDCRPEALPEADLVEEIGGRVELLPNPEEHSTRGVIEKTRGPFNPESSSQQPEAVNAWSGESHGS